LSSGRKPRCGGGGGTVSREEEGRARDSNASQVPCGAGVRVREPERGGRAFACRASLLLKAGGEEELKEIVMGAAGGEAAGAGAGEAAGAGETVLTETAIAFVRAEREDGPLVRLET
jgi:hypothetical protein